MNQEMTWLSRKEIIGNISFERKYRKLMALLFIPWLLLGLLGMRFMDSMFLWIVLFFGSYALLNLVLHLVWYKKFHNSDSVLPEEETRSQIVHAVLAENLRNLRFDPQGKLPDRVLQEPDFPFARGCHTFEGANYGFGMYLVTPVEAAYSAVGNLKTVEDRSEEPGHYGTYQQLDARFSGMVYLLHVNRPYPPTTIHTGRRCSGEIQTGDPEFDRLFSVETQAPQALPGLLPAQARRLLTDSVGKMKKGNVYLHFSPRGDVWVCFDQVFFDVRTKNGTQPFAILDRQFEIVRGLIEGLSGGF